MNGDLWKAPHWFLAIVASVIGGLAIWQEVQWRATILQRIDRAEQHEREASNIAQRIAALEAIVAAREGRFMALESRIGLLEQHEQARR